MCLGARCGLDNCILIGAVHRRFRRVGSRRDWPVCVSRLAARSFLCSSMSNKNNKKDASIDVGFLCQS
jgi:hypothetical protein